MGAILVGIKTCHRLDYFVDDLTVDYVQLKGWRHPIQQERVDAQRQTWLKALPEGVDYKFFYGSTLRTQKLNQRVPDKNILRQPLADELFLPCNDNYTANTLKVRQICGYALANGYGLLVLVDDDTYLDFEKLLATDFAEYHYSGAPTQTFHPGSCVILDRVAMQAILDHPSISYADDAAIGYSLDKAGIKPHSIPAILHGIGDAYRVTPAQVQEKDYVSWHSCSPDIMKALWMRHVTLSSERQKATAGQALKITPSPSVSPVLEEEKFSSSVTLPILPEQPSSSLDSNSLITSVSETIPSSNDLEFLETGSKPIKTESDISSTVMSWTLLSSG